MESKSIPIGERIVGFGWFFYLVSSCLVLGTAMGLSGYCLALLISLGFPAFRRVSDAILQGTISFMLSIQPWLDFDGLEFRNVYSELEKTARDRKTGILIVSNHRSHLDTFLLLARIPGVRVLAKRGLFAVPFLGLVMWTSRQIPVRRKSLKAFVAAMDEIGERLAAGETVHVFPEMTRSAPGYPGVAGFNPAPFLTAMRVGAPILPLAIVGTSETWPKGSFALRKGGSVRVKPLAPIHPSEFTRFGGAKELAEHCRSEIETAFREMKSP